MLNKGLKAIAHRGDIGNAPENTKSAFESAVLNGAAGVEIDIRMSRDKQIVVFHDETFSRLTHGKCIKKISEMDWADIQSISLPYAGNLLLRFPVDGYEKEKEYYYPWQADTEQIVKDKMSKICEQSDDEEQIIAITNKIFANEFCKMEQNDNRTEKVMSLDEFCTWLKKQPQDFFAEIEYKQSGMMNQLIDCMSKHDVLQKCIVFSGVTELNDEIQSWIKINGKPNKLRLGANIRYINEQTMKYLNSYDLYEIGLNAAAFSYEDVKLCDDKGILIFSNLGDYPNWWEMMENLKIAKENGFYIILNYIGVESPEIAKKRVKIRVSRGGYGIPEQDIEKRYYESLNNLNKVINLCDEINIYDNSYMLKDIIYYKNGNLIWKANVIPNWANFLL